MALSEREWEIIECAAEDGDISRFDPPLNEEELEMFNEEREYMMSIKKKLPPDVPLVICPVNE